MEKTIYQKIGEISGLDVTKNAKNPHFNSSFASLDHIMESLRPLMKEQGLTLIHYSTLGFIRTEVRDGSDDVVASDFPLVNSDNPQKIGSCITYGRRYNIVQIFDIMLNDDDDGSAAVPQQKAQYSEPAHNGNPNTCPHTNMQRKEGTSRTGKPYKMDKCGDCGVVEWINN